jgi:hypothetical protein
MLHIERRNSEDIDEKPDRRRLPFAFHEAVVAEARRNG